MDLKISLQNANNRESEVIYEGPFVMKGYDEYIPLGEFNQSYDGIFSI